MKRTVLFDKRYRIIRDIVEVVLLTALMLVVINLTVQNYDVDGISMEPRLHDGERIMVDKVSYWFHEPQRGDVVVFIAPPEPTKDYVKRIIAIPGDTISVIGTKVTVNGVTLQETYVDPSMQDNISPPISNVVVPPGKYFVMGDDRAHSFDSRAWPKEIRFVPRANILGRAMLIYWPLGKDNSGFLPNVSAVFAHVPDPAHKNLNLGLSPSH